MSIFATTYPSKLVNLVKKHECSWEMTSSIYGRKAQIYWFCCSTELPDTQGTTSTFPLLRFHRTQPGYFDAPPLRAVKSLHRRLADSPRDLHSAQPHR